MRVPIHFAGVVDLRPVAIIVAILIFGGIWGSWGVLFAIPLATLVQATLPAWPRGEPDGVPTFPVTTAAAAPQGRPGGRG